MQATESAGPASGDASSVWQAVTAQIDLHAIPLFLVVVVSVVATLLVLRRLLDYRFKRLARFRTPLVMAGLSFVGLVLIIIFLPLEERHLKLELLKLLGILLSGAVALSSTSLLGNAMAGLMLRAVGGFRVGDYVRVGENAGCVSDRGLFHTEIQTEDRDLTTLPNLYLVTNPVQVARRSGTIVSAQVSLGYDVPRGKVKELLERACERARLQKPSVQVVDLGDFSVVYRAAGLLEDPMMEIIRARSRLRSAMLDELHGAGVEIVSPNFMNTRALDSGARFIPPVAPATMRREEAAAVEDVAFDKAVAADALSELEKRLGELEASIKTSEKALAAAGGDDRARLEAELESLRSRRDRAAAEVERVKAATAEI